MRVECDRCAVRGPACGGCLVGALVDAPPGGPDWDDTELRALRVLEAAGLIRPLRHVSVEVSGRLAS